MTSASGQLEFRDARRGAALVRALDRVSRQIGRTVCLMHVCGSHEQAIARYGLRASLPPNVDLVMGPGCPVCVTDAAEIDAAIALAARGVAIVTYADMLRVPGTSASLNDAREGGAEIEIVYSADGAVDLARAHPDREIVFFATGFETTAVATAAVALSDVPANFFILSAHKYIPPAMEVVAGLPGTRVEGFVAAGHAAIVTGSAVFEPFAARHGTPVVVAGFEPLDILAALVRLMELVRDGAARVENMYPRCVTRGGNRRAQAQLWKAFEPADGCWRGIGSIPGGSLRLRKELAAVDALVRFRPASSPRFEIAGSREPTVNPACICGSIMTGGATPADCPLFGDACVPDRPVGACMVSSEGMCRIWHQYGGSPWRRSSPANASR